MNTRTLNEHVSKEVLEMNVVSPKTVTKTCLIGINGRIGSGRFAFKNIFCIFVKKHYERIYLYFRTSFNK